MQIWKPKTNLKALNAIPLGFGLDSLLGDGIPTETITEIYGPPASGKTNISLLATVNAAKAGFRVAYLDPEGSFHLKRVEQIAGEYFDQVIEKTTLLEPESLAHQSQIIRSIIGKPFRLLVVDPITYHYRLELDRVDPFPTNQELAKQLSMLSWHARKKNAAVLVTNQIYSDFKGGYEPLAREVLGYGAKVRVELGIEGDHRTAKLVKHISMKEGKIVKFKIVGGGIIDY